jgi:hypothetical protein
LPLLAVASGAAHGIAGERCERLFALRRSIDRNEVVYEACFQGAAPRPERPVRAHWEMNQTDGHREELTVLEERIAFGVRVESGAEGTLRFALRAAPDRTMELRGSADDAQAVMEIGGQRSALLDVFVSVESMAFIPRVRYVELGGVSMATGALVSERLEP